MSGTSTTYQQDNGEVISNNCLYVTNISDTITQDALWNAFGKFGEVQNVILKMGLPNNYAMVFFVNSSDATKAILALNSAPPLNLRITYAKSKKTESNNNFNRKGRFNNRKEHVRQMNPEGFVTVSLKKGLPSNERALQVAQHLTAVYKTAFDEVALHAAIENKLQMTLLPDLKQLKCAECKGDASKVCGACDAVNYCSTACQAKHWEWHKKICGKAGGVEAPNTSPREPLCGNNTEKVTHSPKKNRTASGNFGSPKPHMNGNDARVAKKFIHHKPYRYGKNKDNFNENHRSGSSVKSGDDNNRGSSSVKPSNDFGFVPKVQKPKENVKEATPVSLSPENYVAALVPIGGEITAHAESLTDNGAALCVVADITRIDIYGDICSIDASAEPQAKISPGTLVAYLDPSDGGWYRARCLNEQGRLWLTDAARFATATTPSNLKQLPAKYVDLPEFSAVLKADNLQVNEDYECVVKEHLADGSNKVLLKQNGNETVGHITRWSEAPSQSPSVVSQKTADVHTNVVTSSNMTTVAASPVSNGTPTPAKSSFPRVERPTPKQGDDVYIVHADKEFVYIRDCSTDNLYNSILKDVVTCGCVQVLQSPPESGTVVIAEYERAFCRALVSRRNVAKDKYLLDYHDFGNMDTTQLANLRACPQNLVEKPVLVARAKLAGVTQELSQSAINWLVNDAAIMKLSVRSVNGEAVRLCSVDSNECINDKVEKMSRPAWMEYINVNLTDLPPIMLSDLNILEIPTDGGLLHVSDASLLKMQAVNCWPSDKNDSIVAVTETLANEMADYCKSEIGQTPYTPRHEELCIAKSEMFDQWLRGICMSVSNVISILFVDFGNIENIPHTNIRRALPIHAQLPALASLCTIVDFPEDISDEKLSEVRIALGLTAEHVSGEIGQLKYTKAVKTSHGTYDVVAPELLKIVK